MFSMCNSSKFIKFTPVKIFDWLWEGNHECIVEDVFSTVPLSCFLSEPISEKTNQVKGAENITNWKTGQIILYKNKLIWPLRHTWYENCGYRNWNSNYE